MKMSHEIAKIDATTKGETRKMLFQSAIRGEWEEVLRTYQERHDSHSTKITRTGETVLHVAVSDGQEDVVEQLVTTIVFIHTKTEVMPILEIRNKRGNTALHYAAALGSVRMCTCLAKEDASLVGVRNHEGETPLFLAAWHGKKDAFMCLQCFCSVETGYSYGVREDGLTILHCAIGGVYFDLAYQIIGLYGDNMVNRANKQGLTPLHILATKPSSFRSSTHLGWFKGLIYHFIFVDELKVEGLDDQALLAKRDMEEKKRWFPENYNTCINLLQLLKDVLQVAIADGTQKKPSRAENAKNAAATKIMIDLGQASHQSQGHQLLPSNYETCFGFIKLLSKVILVVFGLGSKTIKKIQKQKERNIWSVQIMNELLKRDSFHDYEESQRYGQKDPENSTSKISVLSSFLDRRDTEDSVVEAAKGKLKAINKDDNASGEKDAESRASTKSETPILLAAKNGITEMVERILELFPAAIHDENEEKKNAVLLAVENRQPHVYELLLSRNILKDSIFHEVDNKGNSALHLAATLGDYKPWLIPGAALQMQWEIKWFNFVKDSMLPRFFVRYNSEGKSANDIFSETHKELVKNGGEWLTNTSESCSVVAALIATVAFATSTAVPGGVEAGTGMPTLENQPAFNVFAISSLVALCFSVTAVVLFLAILTSRYQESDFSKDLPRKLLVGLTSLFVSIAAMLVSFCAGHFFVLRDKLKYAAFPVYTVTCLPVTLFAIAQFPLYFDLAWATLKKVPQRSYKSD